MVNNKYVSKIKAPIYEPKNEKPNINDLFDCNKRDLLLQEIEKANLSKEEKNFLVEAANRHVVFKFRKIADYYAHSSQTMQELMERSALVIIDFNKAIEEGYVKLSKDIAEQYLKDSLND